MESELLTYESAPLQVRTEVHMGEISSKRIFDVLFSGVVLVGLAPLLGVIAFAVWVSTGVGAIYVQPRLGRGGKVFPCYKFRTMYPDADRRLRELLANPEIKREWHTSQKLRTDPRVFPLGRWLRKSSLDELPQFWNVVKGDLSVVGPRPYMVKQKGQLGHLAATILSVRPGITGLWQTSGRSQTTFAERIQLDAAYLDKRSFWFDLKLILKTIPQIFFSNDAC